MDPTAADAASAAGASRSDAGASQNATANPAVGNADPAGATPPLSSSQSSPRLSPAPAASDSAAGSQNGAKNGAAQATRMRKAATPKAGSGDYTIQRGDTLAAIAKKHNVDAKDLARWNGIDDPRRLRIGQKIRLSAPGS